MKKFYLVALLLSTYFTMSAQYRESQNIWNQMVWDDEKLNILIDTRVDFRAMLDNRYKDDYKFDGQTIKIWLVGEVVPGIRYRIRHRINKVPEISRDNYSGATDHAFISFDAGKYWTITAGKLPVQIGTFENDYNGADVYQGSMVFNDFDGSATGVMVAHKMGKQVFNLQVTNSNRPQFASPNYENKAFAYNILWVGDLFDEVIRTRWGYGMFQHNSNKYYNWVTLGTQVNLKQFTAELDYYTGIRQMDYGYMMETDTLGYRYVQDQSLSLHFEYNWGKWRPFIKGTWDKRYDKWYDATAYRNLGIEAVAEFYPFTAERTKDLRFHAAYAFKNTQYKGHFEALPDRNVHTIIVGTRWMFKAK